MNIITSNHIKCTIALAALKNVMDPEIGLNIVDLGLIYQLDFEETEKKIFCTMTLTTRFCPMGESITNAAKKVMESTFPQWEAVIELTFKPAWNYKMISEEGQQFLNKG
ncbi:MAG: metal-sulfur cluster assembly factor [Chitinophagaceae bacterium]